MSIPLVGCSVRLKVGKRSGETGVVVSVSTYREVLVSMSEHEASMFIRSARSRYGADWSKVWFSASVRVGDEVLFDLEVDDLEILTPDLTRGPRYRQV